MYPEEASEFVKPLMNEDSMRGSKLSALPICNSVFMAAALVVLSFVAFTVEGGAAPRRPLAKSEVIDLLRSGVTPARIADLVGQYGIAFQLTRETEKQLREAGADEALLKALRQSAARASSPAVRPAPAVRSPAGQSRPTGPAVLLIESNPGNAQVYVDDEPVGTTSAQGRLKLSQFAPGKHRVRVALAGYKDHEESVTLAAGETTRVAPSLEAATPAVRTTAPSSQPATAPGDDTGTAAQNQVAGRFAVEHDHGLNGTNYCLGWMTIGNGTLQFASMSFPAHSFSVSLSAVEEADNNPVYLSAIDAFHIRFQDGTELNFCVVNAPGRWQPSRELLQTLHRAMGRK
jgi:hypothetical protein